MNPARRKILLGAMLAGGGGVSFLARPSRRPLRNGQATLDRGLPDSFADWRERDIPGFILPERDALDRQSYDGHVTRAYQRDADPPVYVVVAYGSVQDYALQVHSPQVCYPASGFAILENASVSIDTPALTIPGQRLLAARSDRKEAVVYWTRVGAAFPTSQWETRRQIVLDAMRGEISDGVLVRLSTQAEFGQDAFARLLAFSKLWLASCDQASRALLTDGAKV